MPLCIRGQRRVLFVCIENSFRSQIAEAYFNSMAPPGWRSLSAGTKPKLNVHPNAVKLMLEKGIDSSSNRPKPLTEDMKEVDIVVIMCSELEVECPTVRAGHVEHWRIPNPADMSLEEVRKVRNEIKRRVMELIEKINSGSFKQLREEQS